MSDKVIEFPHNTEQLLCGPFSTWKVIVDGRAIPGLTGFPNGDGRVALVVDDRFSATFAEADARQAAWLIAQAIAVASGYTHLGAENKGSPFAPISMGIDQAVKPL